jgi:hypothetical protein
MRELHVAFRKEHLVSEAFHYESDFVQNRKMMPERQYLAENLFSPGNLRDSTGMEVMDNLVRLLSSTRSQTYCRSLNGSFTECDSCSQRRDKYVDPI